MVVLINENLYYKFIKFSIKDKSHANNDNDSHDDFRKVYLPFENNRFYNCSKQSRKRQAAQCNRHIGYLNRCEEAIPVQRHKSTNGSQLQK